MAAELELQMREFRVLQRAVQVGSKQSFLAWMKGAQPGDRCIYARASALPLGQPGCLEAVREHYETGELDLLQRRLPFPPVGPGGFAYLAIRRRHPTKAARRFVARGRVVHVEGRG